MTNRELAQAFAKGATSGRNSNDTIFIDGNVIYSYGRHWPIALRQGNRAFINNDRYGMTTSKHTGLVSGRLAVEGFQITRVSKAELNELINN